MVRSKPIGLWRDLASRSTQRPTERIFHPSSKIGREGVIKSKRVEGGGLQGKNFTPDEQKALLTGIPILFSGARDDAYLMII